MKKKVKVKTDKTVYTFAYLRAAGWRALEEAKQSEKGRFYKCMTSQLFSALCLEAYLNHIGKEILPYWEKVERKLGPKEKLEIISHEIGLKINYGKRPFQTFEAIFKLRNLLVHGKTEYTNVIHEEMLLEEGEEPTISQINWQNDVNIETANKFLDDSKEILKFLHSKLGYDPSVLHMLETREWSVWPIDNE